MQILFFISGLGILLLAMKMLETSLAGLGEGHLRRGLEQFTRTPLHGVLLGTIATAILQSSSIVGLMTMAFVGAGVLPLRNAIGVVLGANLGTTFTGWLVALVGFKVDLAQFYVLMLGFGGLLSVWGKEGSRLNQWGSFVLAFGFLLFALVLMKDSIVFVIDLVDVAVLRNQPLLLFYLFGVVLTAIIQSSSATMMITLSAMSAGILDLGMAAALVIGSKLGTTSTLVLGSIKGSVVKRQMAIISVLFNLIVSLGSFLCLPLLVMFVIDVLQVTDPLFELVSIFSLTSLAGIVLFLPFVDKLQAMAEKLVPLPPRHELTIMQVSTEVPAASLAAVEQDVRNLMTASVLLNAWRLGILQTREASRKVMLDETAQSSYAELKNQENQLSDYLMELQRVELEPAQVQRVQQMLVCIRDCLYSTKAVKDVESDLVRFRLESGVEVKGFIDQLLRSVEALYGKGLELLEADGSVNTEDFKAMRESVRKSHADSNLAIYHLIDQRGFRHDRASSALNINRELLISAHSLINALEHFLLPGEHAHTVSEWISNRV
jgi:phosphate:Na+ symporter